MEAPGLTAPGLSAGDSTEVGQVVAPNADGLLSQGMKSQKAHRKIPTSGLLRNAWGSDLPPFKTKLFIKENTQKEMLLQQHCFNATSQGSGSIAFGFTTIAFPRVSIIPSTKNWAMTQNQGVMDVFCFRVMETPGLTPPPASRVSVSREALLCPSAGQREAECRHGLRPQKRSEALVEGYFGRKPWFSQVNTSFLSRGST